MVGPYVIVIGETTTQLAIKILNRHENVDILLIKITYKKEIVIKSERLYIDLQHYILFHVDVISHIYMEISWRYHFPKHRY